MISDQELVVRVLDRYLLRPGAMEPGRYRAVPMFGLHAPPRLLELCVLAAFCEVWLAKRDHDGVVGINLLEKIQAPTLPTLYGALLAGVDYVLMGAGIPRHVPGYLDRLCAHELTELHLQVLSATFQAIQRLAFDRHQLRDDGVDVQSGTDTRCTNHARTSFE